MKQAVMFGCIPVVIADDVQVSGTAPHHVVKACMYLELPSLSHVWQCNIQVLLGTFCISQHLCWMSNPWFCVQQFCHMHRAEI